MRYMVVNLDKRQYFRPVELGAPHGSSYWGVAESQDPYDSPWLVFLAHLIESRPEDRYRAGSVGRWYGAWAGDRVVMVRGDDESGRFLPEDLQALNALGAEVKEYEFMRDEYEDLTNDLKKVWPKIDLFSRRYQANTEPPDYGWLTKKVAAERIEFARSQGHDYHAGYLAWASRLPGLRPAVLALLKSELARLSRPAAQPATAAATASPEPGT